MVGSTDASPDVWAAIPRDQSAANTSSISALADELSTQPLMPSPRPSLSEEVPDMRILAFPPRMPGTAPGVLSPALAKFLPKSLPESLSPAEDVGLRATVGENADTPALPATRAKRESRSILLS